MRTATAVVTKKTLDDPSSRVPPPTARPKNDNDDDDDTSPILSSSRAYYTPSATDHHRSRRHSENEPTKRQRPTAVTAAAVVTPRQSHVVHTSATARHRKLRTNSSTSVFNPSLLGRPAVGVRNRSNSVFAEVEKDKEVAVREEVMDWRRVGFVVGVSYGAGCLSTYLVCAV
mmetsp:Transcript_63628/g.75284  ORF Transcript_63628/g.75284 Transcript_63628/m.75284 type:complete len:172 (-) Transcript_63628:62-577(-)